MATPRLLKLLLAISSAARSVSGDGGINVRLMRAAEVGDTLPLAPDYYPDALRGVIWMDQAGYYGHSDVVDSASPDGALSFGDRSNMLGNDGVIYVDTTGPSWQWFNNKLGYKDWSSLQSPWSVAGDRWYRFAFSNNFTYAQIILAYHSVEVSAHLLSFSMTLQTPPPGACPPKPGATKMDVSKCAKWCRESGLGMGLSAKKKYYAFEIIDKHGKKVEPYFSHYVEWLKLNRRPDVQEAVGYGMRWSGGPLTQARLEEADAFVGIKGMTKSTLFRTACSTNTHGTCFFTGCHPSRGPTYCSRMHNHHCMCKPGYCVNQGAGDLLLGRGQCVPDISVPKSCDIDQSQNWCIKPVRKCGGKNQECSGRMGVCQCKQGFCKDKRGECEEYQPMQASETPEGGTLVQPATVACSALLMVVGLLVAIKKRHYATVSAMEEPLIG